MLFDRTDKIWIISSLTKIERQLYLMQESFRVNATRLSKHFIWHLIDIPDEYLTWCWPCIHIIKWTITYNAICFRYRCTSSILRTKLKRSYKQMHFDAICYNYRYTNSYAVANMPSSRAVSSAHFAVTMRPLKSMSSASKVSLVGWWYKLLFR